MTHAEIATEVLDVGFMQDPYSVYEVLRAGGPARYVAMPSGMQAWVVPRYAEARAALADPRLAKGHEGLGALFARQYGETAPEDGDAGLLDAHMLNSDPPDHTRLRKLVNKAFTSRRIERLRPRIEEIADTCLDEMAGAGASGAVDLIDSYAFPIPVTVICELLGVPFEDREDFRTWSAAMLSVGDGMEAAGLMATYLTELVAAKRAAPADDMLTALIQASEDDDSLDHREVVSMAFLLLVAGHETTVNLIGNGVLALLRHPDQLAALRADPGLLPGAVEEFLRYEPPVNMATLRYTVEPVEVGDVMIPEGEFVLVALGGANRDPERFAYPGALDVTRPTGGHLAFGHGIHYCVGAPLARMEGVVAIGRLLARFPDILLAGEPGELQWRQSTLIRGLHELPVTLG
ncbi:MAG: cytochrome P450 [Streptosporangiales bacterium]|nr:cytochrome P450 [Streptosporangiales bacterium]